MKQIKIQKKFWDKMVLAEKKYEFRKLSKGLESGTYEFVNVWKGMDGKGVYYDQETLGTATLTPIDVNPVLDINHDTGQHYVVLKDLDKLEIDEVTYDFVLNNYDVKSKDFVVYEISDVKGPNNGT